MVGKGVCVQEEYMKIWRRIWVWAIPTLITVPLMLHEVLYSLSHPEIYQGLGIGNHYTCLVISLVGAWAGIWFLINLLK